MSEWPINMEQFVLAVQNHHTHNENFPCFGILHPQFHIIDEQLKKNLHTRDSHKIACSHMPNHCIHSNQVADSFSYWILGMWLLWHWRSCHCYLWAFHRSWLLKPWCILHCSQIRYATVKENWILQCIIPKLVFLSYN